MARKFKRDYLCDFQTLCTGYNDIALASLKTPLTSLKTITTVESNLLFHNARNCSVAGFGNEGKILTESKAALYTYQECNETLFKYLMNGYGGVMKLYPGNICAHPQTCNVMSKEVLLIFENVRKVCGATFWPKHPKHSNYILKVIF